MRGRKLIFKSFPTYFPLMISTQPFSIIDGESQELVYEIGMMNDKNTRGIHTLAKGRDKNSLLDNMLIHPLY